MGSAGRVVGVAVAVIAAACTGSSWAGHASEEAPAQAYARGAGAPAAMPCPMAVPSTEVAAADTPDGESITFTTASPGAVADLRDRVRAMAGRLDRTATAASGGVQRSGADGSLGSGDGGKDPAPTGTAAAPPARARVEDVDGGARVTLTPDDAGDLERLRTTVRERVGRMTRTGACDLGS